MLRACVREARESVGRIDWIVTRQAVALHTANAPTEAGWSDVRHKWRDRLGRARQVSRGLGAIRCDETLPRSDSWRRKLGGGDIRHRGALADAVDA